MHYSGAHVFAWMLLLIGTGTLIASIGTDFWSTHRPLESVDVMSMHRGLWKQCTRYLIDTQCVNRFSKFADDVQEVVRIGADVFDGNRTPISNKKLQVFEWVILALMLLSIGLSVLSLLCSPCCCNHCSCCLSFWVLLAGMCSGSACIWYAYQNQMGQTLTFSILQPDDLPLYRMHNQLAWSLYLAACGSICQVMSGVFFACTKSRRFSYSHSV